MPSSDRNSKLVNDLLVLTGQPKRTTPRTRKSIELAVFAAGEFSSPAIDSSHLLCGLLREGSGVAFHVLDRLGLKRERLEPMVLSELNTGKAVTPRLDDDLTIALHRCWTLATALQHNYIGTEHLLLGIVSVQTRARELLQQFGIDSNAINSRILKL